MTNVTQAHSIRDVKAGAAAPGKRILDAILSAGFDLVTGVPDSGLADILAELAERPSSLRHLPSTREDSCVAIAVGSHLAGGCPLVYMKSAGLGVCLDVLATLASVYEIPLVLLVSWTGYAGRDVPHHNAIGEPAADLLHALGIRTRSCRLDDPVAVGEELAMALIDARRSRAPVAVLGIPEGL